MRFNVGDLIHQKKDDILFLVTHKDKEFIYFDYFGGYGKIMREGKTRMTRKYLLEAFKERQVELELLKVVK